MGPWFQKDFQNARNFENTRNFQKNSSNVGVIHVFSPYWGNSYRLNSDSVFSKDALLSHKRERKRTWIPLNPCLVGRGVVPTAR